MSRDLIGQTLLSQFRVDAYIASGGMGAVFRVWDLKRNAPLAMKVLHADLAEDPSVLKRFQNEANSLQNLAHPHIVPFYGLYQSEGMPFLLERYIDGQTLQEILRKSPGQPLKVLEALTFFKALAAALGYAHANGVVHCDVKPGNVLVDQGGEIYLTDFGINRHIAGMTTVGVAGTLAYMAPEQIRAERVRPATDVYGLGCLLFELLTGQRVFRGTEPGAQDAGPETTDRIRYAQLYLPPPDPRGINPTLPEKLSRVLATSLAKEPGARYPGTIEFWEAACAAVGIQPGLIPTRTSILSHESASDRTLPAVPKEQLIPSGRLEPSSARVAALQPRPASGKGQPARGSGVKRSAGIRLLTLGGLVVLAVLFYVALPKGTAPQPVTPIPIVTAERTPTVTAAILLPVSLTADPKTVTPSTPTRSPYALTQTPRIPSTLTLTPTPTLPKLVLDKGYFCRGGPSLDTDQIWSFPQGTELDIVGKSTDGWWLIQFKDPGTRHDKCWISGGNPEGDLSKVPYSDYLTYK